MKQHERQCGNCSHWMTNQCPFERAGSKQTMSGLSCKDFDWQHHIRAAMVVPIVPDVRIASSPMVVWGESTKRKDGMRTWEGVCYDGDKVEIYDFWTGWGFDGVVVSRHGKLADMGYIQYRDSDQAQDAVEAHLRAKATNDMHYHWAAMAQAMYALGLDHPISVYQRAPKLGHIRPAAPFNELEGVDQ